MTYLANTKPVSEFVSYIRERLERATTSWREIAEAFAEAKEVYGGESDAFRKLCKETSFSKSTAYKLAGIASSERLTKYRDKLSAVQSWGTLYAIVTLTEEKFAVLREQFKLDDPNASKPILTQSMVEAVRKEKRQETNVKVYAVVYVDEQAMKAGLFDGDHIVTLEDSLDVLRKTLPYLKVTKSGLEERIESEYFEQVQKKKVELARKEFSEELKSVDSRLKKQKRKGETPKELFKRSICMSKEELWEMFTISQKEAFDYLGSDRYNETELFEKAVQLVNNQRENLAMKVRNTAEPYKYANTMVKAEFSQTSCAAADALVEDDNRNTIDIAVAA